MKKSTMGVTIFFIVLIVSLVGVYAILTGMARTEADEAKMTAVQTALNKDLEKDFPATVKEVVKYYTDLEKCVLNEEYTESELEQLAVQMRKLFDADLQANNELAVMVPRLRNDATTFKDTSRKITNIAVAASTNVDYFTEDNYEFARIYCGYSVLMKGKSFVEGRVYLLRRDADRHWKIFGWENADKVNPK